MATIVTAQPAAAVFKPFPLTPSSACQPSRNEWAPQGIVNGAADPKNMSLKTKGKTQIFNFVAITNLFTSEI